MKYKEFGWSDCCLLEGKRDEELFKNTSVYIAMLLCLILYNSPNYVTENKNSKTQMKEMAIL
jgi:hypothetical protein